MGRKYSYGIGDIVMYHRNGHMEDAKYLVLGFRSQVRQLIVSLQVIDSAYKLIDFRFRDDAKLYVRHPKNTILRIMYM